MRQRRHSCLAKDRRDLLEGWCSIRWEAVSRRPLSELIRAWRTMESPNDQAGRCFIPLMGDDRETEVSCRSWCVLTKMRVSSHSRDSSARPACHFLDPATWSAHQVKSSRAGSSVGHGMVMHGKPVKRLCQVGAKRVRLGFSGSKHRNIWAVSGQCTAAEEQIWLCCAEVCDNREGKLFISVVVTGGRAKSSGKGNSDILC